MRYHKDAMASAGIKTFFLLVGCGTIGPIWTSHHSNYYLTIHHKSQSHLKKKEHIRWYLESMTAQIHTDITSKLVIQTCYFVKLGIGT
jgi:hypothetical protein